MKGANAALHADELGEAPFAGRALHVAGALVLDALDGEPTAALLAEARQRGIHTSLDTVFDGSGRWERVLPALPHCDLVTPGLAEALAITGEHEPGTRGRAAARARRRDRRDHARPRRLLRRRRGLRRTRARRFAVERRRRHRRR